MLTAPCFGDFGSPIWMKVGTRDILVAVVSTYHYSNQPCAEASFRATPVTNDEVRQWIDMVRAREP